MEFQIVSDMHMDRGRMDMFEWIARPVADTLVIAGDFCHLKNFEQKRVAKFIEYMNDNWKTVIFVPGNHDYCGMLCGYGAPVFEHCHEVVGNMVIANNTTVDVDDVTFVCTTMWSHIPPNAEFAVKEFIWDFKEIGNFNVMFHNRLNDIAAKYIRDTVPVALKAGRKVVVVTHHLPTWQVVSDPYKNDDVTYAFANTKMDDVIMDNDIAAWVHGHSHDARHDILAGTLVIRNPYGLANQRGKCGHNPECVVNV